ncbi:MAG TPA: SUMF1/EgtB/PvdO family nonheme iron enzyme, partial [Gemmataceae bacterium]|nr:SUMF1/EgtB/PvdO family nonheme iron enzyme [Gemmataceae bacterium]
RDMAFQHLEGRADLRGLQPAEQAVISRALSPDPEKRYPSCQAFIQALLDLHAPPPPKPPGSRWSTFVLATGLVMALSVIAVLIYGLLRPRVYLCPPGWQPPSGNLITNFFKPDLVQDLRGRHYWRSLSHRVGNQEVVMLVIPSKKSTDPNTFYIMRDKVSNDLFKAVMETERAKELLDTRLRESGLQTTDDKLPNYIQLGQWKRGARVSNFPAIGASTFGWLASPGGQERLLTAAALTIEKSETDLGIAGENGKLPVLGVTVLEAHVFAEVLGCKLPQKVQILKAAGYGEEGSGEGPFQLDPQLASRDPYDPQRYPGIAINLTELGPRPVGTSEKDVSIYGCRDLAGNGMELTRTLSRPDDPREVPVKGIGNTIPRVCIVGKNYEDDTPWRFKDVLHNTPDVPYNVTTHYYSFRIVLEE